MTYTLDLSFQPAIDPRLILGHFATQRHFGINGNDIVYTNPDTEVRFWITLNISRDIFFRQKIRRAEFIINYFRPGYFALEAEIKLSAFMKSFHPRITDGQIDGMDEGPYSGDGFLSGWNFGNLFSVHNALRDHPHEKLWSMPADKLKAIWQWNYKSVERRALLRKRLYIPTIMIFMVEGRACSAVIWTHGGPISIPQVDYVLIARPVGGDNRMAIAPWSDVVSVARVAGFGIENDVLELSYSATPAEISRWIGDLPLVDLNALRRLHPSDVFETELIDAARHATRFGPPLTYGDRASAQ